MCTWVALSGWGVLVVGGCKETGCLSSDLDESCTMPSPCRKIAFQCSDTSVSIETISPGTRLPGGLNAAASPGDFLLQNSKVSVVIDALDHPHSIAPSGGSILDMTTQHGDNDSINNIFQATGLLPWDAPKYTVATVKDRGPHMVAIQFRGTLDGRPDVPVSTRYELRPCEPGIRIRTEVVNQEAEPGIWTVADGFFWGGKSNLAFTPYPGAGFDHPSFGLSEIDDVFRQVPFVVGTAHTTPGNTLVSVGCNFDRVAGFHSEYVSAVGTPKRIVPPRDYEVFERFVGVADGIRVAGGADMALALREQLFDEPYAVMTGDISVPAPLQMENEVHVSLTISEGTLSTPREDRIPWTQTTPLPDGSFKAAVPSERTYVIEVSLFGIVQVEREVRVGTGTTDAGTIAVPPAGAVGLELLVDGVHSEGLAFFHPSDETTGAAVEAKLHTRYSTCAPLLGAPHGPSPACNRALVSTPTTITLPPGNYAVYGTAGPFATLDRQLIQVIEGEKTDVILNLARLPVQPPDTLNGDFHVHGAPSVDSSIPDLDRVRAFLASGLDVIVATDHDTVWSYAQAMEALGAHERIVLLTGTESTSHILHRWVPGDPTPKVVGHWNFWPLEFQPEQPYNGAPWDELAEPGLLMTRMEDVGWSYDYGVVQLNHPWDIVEFGRDLGFPRAIGLQADEPLLMDAPNEIQGVFHRIPEGARFRNSDYHCQEVMNGTRMARYLMHRAFWFYLLNEGVLRAGTANSDSHGLTDNVLGYPRNIVFTQTDLHDFDVIQFNRDVRQGHLLGTNGPVIRATMTDVNGQPRQPGIDPVVPGGDSRIHISVTAAPWVPVEEIRVVLNGRVVKTIRDELSHPLDPFGTDGLLRYDGSIDLNELLQGNDGDAWILIEAGRILVLHGDLDCDGIPDTSDNNGDGVVDWRDVDRNDDDVVDEEDTKGGAPEQCEGGTGPLNDPDPAENTSSPLYHFEAVVPDGYPAAFTNPFVLDRDSNGYTGAGR